MGGKAGNQYGIKLPTKFFVRYGNSYWTTGKTGQINAFTRLFERDKDMTNLGTDRQLRNTKTQSQDGNDKDWGNGTNWRLGSDKRKRCRLQQPAYTGCPRRNVKYFGRVFLMLNYTDITQNTYIQSWTVTEIMAREVWNVDSCYTLIDCQIHIETGRNISFL